MIIILKRDDLSEEFHHQAVGDLKLEDFKLAIGLIEKAEVIVFVDGDKVKFLKHFPELQSKDSFDVLVGYIASTSPLPFEPIPFAKKRIKWHKKKPGE